MDKKLSAMKRAIKKAVNSESNTGKPGFSSFRNIEYGLSEMSNEECREALSQIEGLRPYKGEFIFDMDRYPCLVWVCSVNETYLKVGINSEIRFLPQYFPGLHERVKN